MPKTPYTPGPWEMNLGVDGAVVYHPDHGTIAAVPIDLSAHPHNAALIAAAPALVEALEELINAPDDESRYNAALDARKLLAEAKGVTHA